MRKPTICIGEKKDADQLRVNREADQRLCFCCTDSTIPVLSESKISSLQNVHVYSVTGNDRSPARVASLHVTYQRWCQGSYAVYMAWNSKGL